MDSTPNITTIVMIGTLTIIVLYWVNFIARTLAEMVRDAAHAIRCHIEATHAQIQRSIYLSERRILHTINPNRYPFPYELGTEENEENINDDTNIDNRKMEDTTNLHLAARTSVTPVKKSSPTNGISDELL